jgi:outer membrane biosynthesis protein TonB
MMQGRKAERQEGRKAKPECSKAGRQGRKAGVCLSAFLLSFSAFLPYCLAALPLLAVGCHRAHAKTTPENPPLDMPAAPPREVEPIEVETPQPVPLPQEPARTAPPRPRPPIQQAARPEQPKTEPPKTEPPPAAEPPKPEEPAKPPTLLQTTPPNTEGDLERGIRATLLRAATDLNRVDAARLTADARVQYETAKSFIRQADQAVRAKNLLFAKSVADKAAVLAAQLAPK